MRRKLIAGNWKMHGTQEFIREYVDALMPNHITLTENRDVVVIPPFPYLSYLNSLFEQTNLSIGAQNVSSELAGAFTGEVSAEMLKDAGCDYVLVGHSERRTLFNESNELVAKKLLVAKSAGLTPILCVGETLEQRVQGITEATISNQIQAVIELGGDTALEDTMLAYEPVWAIGTGQTATPEQAQNVHEFIRNRLEGLSKSLSERIIMLYGGSVKASNAAELMSMPDIDGALVGGASLKAEDFIQICETTG